MNNSTSMARTTTTIISVVSLYLSAVFLAIEFILVALGGRLPIIVAWKPLLLSLILYVLRGIVKKINPNRFINSRVNTLLGMFLSLSLSVYLVSLVDKNFLVNYQNVIGVFENIEGMKFARYISFTGMGIFFLVFMFLIFLMNIKEKGKKTVKVIADLLMVLVCGFTLYVIVRFGVGGWERMFVENYMIPLVQYIIGSLSVGWFYELFIGSLEKSRMNVSLSKK